MVAQIQWFVSIENKPVGPLTQMDIIQKLRSQAISSQTLVWRQGLDNWVPLHHSELSLLIAKPTLQLVSRSATVMPSNIVAINTENFGGFWLRVAAATIDGMFLFFPQLAVELVVRVFVNQHRAGLGLQFAALLFNATLTFCYYVILQARLEGTFGKRIMGLRVVSDAFEPMSIPQSFLRYTVRFVSFICFGMGCIAVAFHERKQSWHDRVAKTLVVRKEFLEAMRQPVKVEGVGEQKNYIPSTRHVA